MLLVLYRISKLSISYLRIHNLQQENLRHEHIFMHIQVFGLSSIEFECAEIKSMHNYIDSQST